MVIIIPKLTNEYWCVNEYGTLPRYLLFGRLVLERCAPDFSITSLGWVSQFHFGIGNMKHALKQGDAFCQTKSLSENMVPEKIQQLIIVSAMTATSLGIRGIISRQIPMFCWLHATIVVSTT